MMKNRLLSFLFCACMGVSPIALHAGNAQLSAMQAEDDAPQMEYVMTITAELGEGYAVGDTPRGMRYIIPITGGSFEGPNIHGVVLPGGADYQLVNKEMNRTDLEAIYCIRTHDGVTIHIRNTGIIVPEGSDTYFLTTPKFEAPADSHYAWLNNAIFLCRPAGFLENAIQLKIWKAGK